MITRILICTCVMVAMALAAYVPEEPEVHKEVEDGKGPAHGPHFPYGGGYPWFGGFHGGYGAGGYGRGYGAAPGYFGYPYNYNPFYNPWWGGAAPYFAGPGYGNYNGHQGRAPYYGHAFAGHLAGYSFVGLFKGTCEEFADGLYYVDDRSFAYCSNGIKTIQACAEGSSNPDLGDFQNGKFKAFHDFCSINDNTGY